MKHVTMGTAGHIDHGKTTLVKALTGVDTDRLSEEKKRGITIELGFAPLILPSGIRVSTVDVPGHEKFLKTMVAGVSGIDFALFVVAADEGVMPQTKEHLDVLNVLGIEKGIVALTKSDLVDEDEISERIQEIEVLLKATSLEGSPIIPVSVVDGSGISSLIEAIDNKARLIIDQPAHGLFRMPVDRVFTMDGHGTVVTGTIIGGKINKGDQVEILPEGILAKVRNIQVHNESLGQGIIGDRCAINLARVEKREIHRGSVITKPNSMKTSSLLDVSLMTVKAIDPLHHNQRVHVHLGTKEVLGRIRLLESDAIEENSRGYAQLRLEEPIVAQRGDRFIIRAYSPLVTLGGGSVLWSQTDHRKRFESGQMEELERLDEGDPKDLLLYRLEEEAKLFTSKELQGLPLTHEEEGKNKPSSPNTSNSLETLLVEGKIGYLDGVDKYFGMVHQGQWDQMLVKELANTYKKYPYRYQLSKEEIKSKVFPSWTLKDLSALLKKLSHSGSLSLDGIYVSEKNGVEKAKIYEKPKVQRLEKYLLEHLMVASSAPLISEDLGLALEETKEILAFLEAAKLAKSLGDGTYIHNKGLQKGQEILRDILDREGEITVAQYRDKLGSGRKTAIALLEYFDKMQVTLRNDLIRKPGPRYREVL